MSRVAPYGAWESPIKSDAIASATLRLGWTASDAGSTYWLEGRPSEGGRQVIVCRDQSGTEYDINAGPSSVRSLVHEYGGGAYAVKSGVVYYTNYDDQCIYRVKRNEPASALTEKSKYRFADFTIDEARGRLFCVREDHSLEGVEAVNTLVVLSTNTVNRDGGTVVVSGNNFYSTPRLSHDGKLLAWLTWNHPNMPWDGTELWLASVGDDGTLQNARRIAGGADESVFQPEWSPDGTLYFVSDKTGWWNLYALIEPATKCEEFALAPMDKEFGLPLWVFGMNTYAVVDAKTIICGINDRGTWNLAKLEVDVAKRSATVTSIDMPFTEVEFFSTDGRYVAFCGSSPTAPAAVLRYDTGRGAVETLRKSSDANIDERYISKPETIEFPSEDGRTAYAYFYPPQNGDFRAPEGELPPLLLQSHGGPTGATSSSLNLGVQYWTSRGFAVVDVNYGGSTGFGRAYRNLLRGNWGIVDVQDCEAAAKYLAGKKRVDPRRMAITGGSAGGYTTLCALTFGDTFHAGASHFGIGDLYALATDTHKFEARYGDTLVAPVSEKQIYHDRSPINFVERLTCPVIFFQGLEDKVVPPKQAETMVEALKQKKLPVAYIAYEGEQHGFRNAHNIKRTLDAELYFYSRIFHFDPADKIEPVEIHNLEALALKR